jgi:hypothetical protein
MWAQFRVKDQMQSHTYRFDFLVWICVSRSLVFLFIIVALHIAKKALCQMDMFINTIGGESIFKMIIMLLVNCACCSCCFVIPYYCYVDWLYSNPYAHPAHPRRPPGSAPGSGRRKGQELKRNYELIFDHFSSPESRLTVQTKNVTRINQDDPVLAAIEISQVVWPATHQENRPGTVLIGIKGNPTNNLPAVTLIHHPNNGPLLYSEKNQLTEATMNELKRLNPIGSPMNKNIQVILVGDFANNVRQSLEEQRFKVDSIPGTEPAELAKKLDAYYAKTSGGTFPQGVVIGSLDFLEYTLPAANWIAHMPEPLLYVRKDSIPQDTIEALKQRGKRANIYLLGPENVISKKVEQQLQSFGKVTRIAGVTPEENAIAFARFKDPSTRFGWGITQPGHGFVFVRVDQPDTAIVSAAFSHLGKHAPMLVLQRKDLSPIIHQYLKSVQPKYKEEPTEGPYNHGYLVGTERSIPFSTQGKIDEILEIVHEHGNEHTFCCSV